MAPALLYFINNSLFLRQHLVESQINIMETHTSQEGYKYLERYCKLIISKEFLYCAPLNTKFQE